MRAAYLGAAAKRRSAPVYALFDPTHTNAGVTLSESNVRMTGDGSSNWRSSFGDRSVASGKWYWEFQVMVASGGSVLCGVSADRSTTTGNYVGATVASWGFGQSGQRFTNGGGATISTAPVATDVIMVAIDVGGGKIWFGKNGTWISGNPAAGTGPDFSGVTGSAFYPGGAVFQSNSLRLHTDPATQAYAAPAGFTAGPS